MQFVYTQFPQELSLSLCIDVICTQRQGRGKVFYVGGAVGGGGGSQFRQIETENRAIAYALS